MGTTPEIDLVTLARTDARGFLSAFLEKLATNGGSAIGPESVYDIEELDETNKADGVFIKVVYAEGGGEGGGEHVERVFSVNGTEGPVSYLRVTGYYQSYNGTDWNDDWELVEPRKVVVTQYFKI